MAQGFPLDKERPKYILTQSSQTAADTEQVGCCAGGAYSLALYPR